MNKEYNEITFCLEDYSDEEDMFRDIATTLKILTHKGSYECQFYCDEAGLGIYCLKYNYSPEKGFGNSVIEWINPDKEYIEEIESDE